MPDIEQQLAPNNLMASHSIVYSFDNFTMWGLWDSIQLNQVWVLQLGLSCGVDIAPWEHQDPGDQPTGTVMLQYISPGGHDSFYVGANSINNGTFGFNNLQECIESYTHKFNEKWWTTFEAQYMWMDHCTTAPTPNVPYQDGWFPVQAGTIAEGGVVNYTMFRFAPNAFLNIRNQWWDDGGGARSGLSDGASPFIPGWPFGKRTSDPRTQHDQEKRQWRCRGDNRSRPFLIAPGNKISTIRRNSNMPPTFARECPLKNHFNSRPGFCRPSRCPSAKHFAPRCPNPRLTSDSARIQRAESR
jgi:hypothetical protein